MLIDASRKIFLKYPKVCEISKKVIHFLQGWEKKSYRWVYWEQTHKHKDLFNIFLQIRKMSYWDIDNFLTE